MTALAANTSIKTTKISIPHPLEDDCFLVGTLEQVAPTTHGRKIALILHGAGGHKDYLFQKKLALRLPIDSFRFDFRGNHESGGVSFVGKYDRDVEDLEAVIEYLHKEFGYLADMLVGHSRGSVVAMLWLCRNRDSTAKSVRRFVNVSGRYRMEKTYGARFVTIWNSIQPTHIAAVENLPKARREQLDRAGYIEETVAVARKSVTTRATLNDYHELTSVDTSIVWTQFPAHVDVLTIHGMNDTVVPPYDACIFARVFGTGCSATHTLRYVEHADHNFTGTPEVVVDTVLEWMSLQEKNELKTGVWQSGVKGKL